MAPSNRLQENWGFFSTLEAVPQEASGCVKPWKSVSVVRQLK